MMESTIVQNEYFEFLWILIGHVIKEGLEGLAIAMRHLQQQAGTCDRRKGAKQIQVVEAVQKRRYRLYSSGGDHSSKDSQQTKAAFILKIQIEAAAPAYFKFYLKCFEFFKQVF